MYNVWCYNGALQHCYTSDTSYLTFPYNVKMLQCTMYDVTIECCKLITPLPLSIWPFSHKTMLRSYNVAMILQRNMEILKLHLHVRLIIRRYMYVYISLVHWWWLIQKYISRIVFILSEDYIKTNLFYRTTLSGCW